MVGFPRNFRYLLCAVSAKLTAMTRRVNAPSCDAVRNGGRRLNNWCEASECDHFVQFYRTEDYLIECLAGFLADGMRTGANLLVIATPEHRAALDTRLREKGLIHGPFSTAEHYVALDARETLNRFMKEGRPDRALFMASVGQLVRDTLSLGRPVRAFGEMVAILWSEGARDAAIELEQLWNELGREQRFTLFCAYPASSSDKAADRPGLEDICASHSAVISLTA